MRRNVCFLVLVFLMSGVLGVEGVIPGSYEVDFEPGLEREFVFEFVLAGEGELKVRGDLAEYLELDKEEVVGQEEVVAKLKLPESLDSFGVNNIWIIARGVAGIVKVKVPYPERYLDLGLSVGDVNAGEEIDVNLKVSNFGVEGFNISPVVEIYFEDEVVEQFSGETRFLVNGGESNYEFVSDGVDYSAGDYLAVARVEDFVAEDFFRLGEFGLKILNFTREVRAGGPRKFEVEVESLSDSSLEGVFAEVRVIGRQSGDKVVLDRVGGFDSSIVSLAGWERKTLVGYFDTEGLEGEAMLSIDVHYDGAVVSEVVRVEVLKNLFWYWVGGGILGFIIVGLFFWWGFKSK